MVDHDEHSRTISEDIKVGLNSLLESIPEGSTLASEIKVFDPYFSFADLPEYKDLNAKQILEKLYLDICFKSKSIGLRVDLDRLLLLFNRGGIYTDMDIHIKDDMFAYPASYFDIVTSEYNPGEINNDFIACGPKNPLIKDYIFYIMGLSRNSNRQI